MLRHNIKPPTHPKDLFVDEMKKIYKPFSPSREYRENSLYQELLFSEPSILFILAELLELAIPSETVYEIEYLQKRYDLYHKAKPSLLFVFDDLFKTGWLIRWREEWQFVGNRYTMGKFDTSSQSKDAQMVDFIKSLKDVPYSDGIFHKIDIGSLAFGAVLEHSKKNLQWFYDREILLEENGCVYIRGQGNIWREFGDRVLSYKLIQWLKESGEEAKTVYKRWFEFCKGIPSCYCPEKFLKDEIKEIYTLGLDYLEAEESPFEWTDISHVLEKLWKLETRNLEKSYDIDIPVSQRSRYNILTRQHYEMLCALSEVNSRSVRFFAFCSQNYDRVSRDLRARFCRILRQPMHKIFYFYVGRGNDLCMLDCLDDATLFYETCRTLSERLFLELRQEDVLEIQLDKFGKHIWNQLFNGMYFSIDSADQKAWVQNLIDWALFLCCEAEKYRRPFVGATLRQRLSA